MKEWQIIAKEKMQIIEKPSISPGENEIKVKVKKAAITSTDIALYIERTDKEYPIVPVRIASGLVSEADDQSGYKKGERVLLSPYYINRTTQGQGPTSVMGLDLNGYLADYVVVPESNVYQLPDGVTDEDALFTEYIAMGVKTLQALNVDKQDYVAIFGANALSNIIAQLAIYYKAIPIVIDKDEVKLKVAENSGIYYAINSDKENIKNKIKEITGGKYADSTVFACRATQDPPLAFDIAAYGGRVGIIGYNRYVSKLSADLRPILLKRLSVFGINSGVGMLDTALNLLTNKAVRVSHLINKTVDFERAEELFIESAEEKDKYLKVVVDC
ncbi:MAG: zinc-dependent alcohol dehydrogenase [Christensenellales bacterium]|jgi:L-gulonate 5-dehydrogenase